MLGDNFGCHNGVVASPTGLAWVEAGNAAKHPTMRGTAPNKESPS